MLTVSEWFHKNTRRPLAMVAILVSLLWAALVVKSYTEISRSHEAGFSQIIDVSSLALAQKNRILIESILQTARTQLGAHSVSICRGQAVLVTTGQTLEANCRSQNSIREKVLRSDIPGFSDFSLVMTFYRLSVHLEQAFVLLFGLALVATVILLLNRVQDRFQDEVMGDLKAGIIGGKTLAIAELEELRLTLLSAQEANASMAVANAIFNITKQVSHDIRSPLSALNMLACSIQNLPDDKRSIIRNATQRINDIANGLLNHGRSLSTTSSIATIPPRSDGCDEPAMVVPLLEALISEKRMQYRDRPGVELVGDLSQGYGLFATIKSSELSRVISNLINNSVEALYDAGQVKVSIRRYNTQLAIIVTDNGRGIPPEAISHLGEYGFSFGKSNSQSGSGLGLYHARKTIEESGGTLSIQSKINQGTIVTIVLPSAKPPSWFVESIELTSGTIVVSLDDDPTIHHAWDSRLKSSSLGSLMIEHLAFADTESFGAFFKHSSEENSLFLVDYEIGQQNGLEVIEKLGIQAQAILVTSLFDEPAIRQKASRLGIKILPKSLLPLVPIRPAISPISLRPPKQG